MSAIVGLTPEKEPGRILEPNWRVTNVRLLLDFTIGPTALGGRAGISVKALRVKLPIAVPVEAAKTSRIQPRATR
jgi:hypothetical protein